MSGNIPPTNSQKERMVRMALLNLSEFIELPDGLTEDKRNICIALANLFGLDIAEELANALKGNEGK
jgi:hypothetical protein